MSTSGNVYVPSWLWLENTYTHEKGLTDGRRIKHSKLIVNELRWVVTRGVVVAATRHPLASAFTASTFIRRPIGNERGFVDVLCWICVREISDRTSRCFTASLHSKGAGLVELYLLWSSLMEELMARYLRPQWSVYVHSVGRDSD